MIRKVYLYYYSGIAVYCVIPLTASCYIVVGMPGFLETKYTLCFFFFISTVLIISQSYVSVCSSIYLTTVSDSETVGCVCINVCININ